MRYGSMTAGWSGLRHKGIPTVVAVAALLAPGAAWAQSWTIGGSLAQYVEYDDNIFDDTSNAEDAWGFRTVPALDLQYAGELTTLRLGGRMELVRYPEFSQMHRENYHFDLAADHRRERTRYGLTFNFDDRSAQDTGVDLESPLAPDIRQRVFAVRPFFSYELTQRNAIEVPINYSHVTYDGPGTVDHDRYGFSVNFTHRLDERNTAVVAALFDHYLPDGAGEHIGYGGTVGWRHDYSEVLQLAVGAGAQRIEPQDNVGRSQTGLLLNASLSYRPELGQVDLSYTRSFEPTVRGNLREVDALRLRGTTAIDERTGVEAGLAYISGDEDGVVTGSDVFEATAALTYRFWEDLSLRPSYRFRYQDYEGTAGSVTSNLVMLGIVWTPRRIGL